MLPHPTRGVCGGEGPLSLALSPLRVARGPGATCVWLVEGGEHLPAPLERDWNVFDKARRGTSDRFALRFVKPAR